MLISVLICLFCFVSLVAFLRFKRISLGLPIAYLGSLLLIHVPGAIAHIADGGNLLKGGAFTEVGIFFTAIAASCFLFGVWLSHLQQAPPVRAAAPRAQFWNFCLFGGILVTTISYLTGVPTFGAILQKGGPIWMFAVMLGLRSAMLRRDVIATWRWLFILALYPTLMLLLGGFLSYGSVVAMIVLSALAVTARSAFRVTIGTLALVFVGISIFLGYFQNRDAIRGAVWGGRDTEARIQASMNAVNDVQWFDPGNSAHLWALDARLNQNYFVGLAAARIESGKSEYLYGKTLWEGALSLIPRALWPDKPIKAGSGDIVSEMTGLLLSKETSFGVGNVMEFHINFGVFGIVIGMTLFGVVIGRLDRRAAEFEIKGELGKAVLYFLPCVAIIQPNGSMVEILSGGGAAIVAGMGWGWAWQRWPKPKDRRYAVPNSLARTVS
jgi:hypothetical protein